MFAERPKLSPVRDDIRRQVAELLKVGIEQVNVKATTPRSSGFSDDPKALPRRAAVLLIHG